MNTMKYLSNFLKWTLLSGLGLASLTMVALESGWTQALPDAEPLQTPDNWISYPASATVKLAENESATRAFSMASTVRMATTDDTGAILPPYLETFDDKNYFANNFVTENPAGGNKWYWSNGTLRSPRSYDGPNNAWVIFPAMRLEGGKGYDLTLNATRNSPTSNETFNIKLGKAQNAASCTTVVAEGFELPQSEKSTDTVSVNAIISVETSGVYYIAIQWTSPENNHYVYFDNITLSGAKDMGMPKQVTYMTVTPDPTGAHKASLRFRTPNKDLKDAALTSLDKAEIYRNGTLVKTVENPAMNKFVTVEDEVPAGGDYTYSVTVSNDKGTSKPVEKTAYIGVDYPVAVGNIEFKETATYGVVNLKWSAPPTDINGNTLDPKNVYYEVRQNTTNMPLIGTTEPGQTNVTFKVVEPTADQLFLSVAVFPVTERGRGDGVSSKLIAVGTPNTLPYLNMFGNSPTYSMAVQTLAGSGQWANFADNDNLTDADGSGGYLGYAANTQNSSGLFHSARINLTDAQNPEYTVYVHEICSDPSQESSLNRNEVKLIVREAGTEEWVPVKGGTIHDLVGNPKHWGRVRADLSAYKGKIIEVGLIATATHYPGTFFDNMRVAETVSHDLCIAETEMARTAMAGEPLHIGVWVENCGASTVKAGDFRVELYRKGETEPFHVIPGQELAVSQRKLFSYDYMANPIIAGTTEYQAKVVYAADVVPENNESAMLTQSVFVNTSMPVPSGLNALLTAEKKPQLKWEGPRQEDIPQITMERFDDLTPFEYTNRRSDAGWYFVETDALPHVSIYGCEIPNLSPGSSVGWFCVDDRNAYVKASQGNLYSHSANNFMVAMSTTAAGPNPKADDWMMSPRLSGRKQTVSFYAKAAYSMEETLEMLYTTGTDQKATGAYVSAGTTTLNKGGLWEPRSFEVPEGANYFALRYISPATHYMLHIDDVQYDPYRETPIAVVGYNLYRDSVRVNATPLATPTFIDTEAPNGEHTYAVTALYNNGYESGLSEPATIISAVTGLDADNVRVYTDGGVLCIDNAAGRVEIYDVTGICRFAGIDSKIRLQLPSGIYLIRTAGRTRKINL